MDRPLAEHNERPMRRSCRAVLAVWLLAGLPLVLGGCGQPTVQPPAGVGPESVPQVRELGASSTADAGSWEPRVPTSSRGLLPLDPLRESATSANLVICVIDAARADHVGCYGYPRDTTPNMDRIAAESVVFEQHFAPYPHTKPSTVSLFTSQYPDTHLVVHRRAMRPNIFSMANVLGLAGFQTAFFSASPMATPAMGVGADFEFVCARERARAPGGMATRGAPRRALAGARMQSTWKTSRALLKDFYGWLDEERAGRFFAYVHFLPPHLPYEAPKEMLELFEGKEPPRAWQGDFEFPQIAHNYYWKPLPLAEWVNLYDANLRWADQAVGELETALQQRDLLDNTLLVVTSDHGEAFGEHGYMRHIYGVYDELVHVPLLLRFPGPKPIKARVGALTHTVDLLPTILDLFQIPSSGEAMQGRSLLPLLSGAVNRVHDYVFATCSGDTRSYLVRSHDWALILWEGGELRALYDLRDDPRQTRNVIAEHPQQAAQMADAFRRFATAQRLPPLHFLDPNAKPAELPVAPQVEITDDMREELRALGYIE